MHAWNLFLPNEEPYTKEEYSNSKYFNVERMLSWNDRLPNVVKYTENEINIQKKLEQ